MIELLETIVYGTFLVMSIVGLAAVAGMAVLCVYGIYKMMRGD